MPNKPVDQLKLITSDHNSPDLGVLTWYAVAGTTLPALIAGPLHINPGLSAGLCCISGIAAVALLLAELYWLRRRASQQVNNAEFTVTCLESSAHTPNEPQTGEIFIKEKSEGNGHELTYKNANGLITTWTFNNLTPDEITELQKTKVLNKNSQCFQKIERTLVEYQFRQTKNHFTIGMMAGSMIGLAALVTITLIPGTNAFHQFYAVIAMNLCIGAGSMIGGLSTQCADGRHRHQDNLFKTPQAQHESRTDSHTMNQFA